MMGMISKVYPKKTMRLHFKGRKVSFIGSSRYTNTGKDSYFGKVMLKK